MNHSLNFIDPSARLGENVKVWHFAVVLAGVAIGDNVSIGSGCEIGRGSIIGKNTRIGSGVFLPPNTLIGENCFISPHVCMCDDKQPRVNNHDYEAQPPVIHNNVSIGAGCVILPGVTIHKGARIGAGSVVTRDVPSNSLVYGERAIERNPTYREIKCFTCSAFLPAGWPSDYCGGCRPVRKHESAPYSAL